MHDSGKRFAAFSDIDGTLTWGYKDRNGDEHEGYLIPAWALYLVEDEKIAGQPVEWEEDGKTKKGTKYELARAIAEIDAKLLRGELSGAKTAEITAHMYLKMVAGMQYGELVERATDFARKRVELYDYTPQLIGLFEKNEYDLHVVTGLWDEICEGLRLSGKIPHVVLPGKGRLCQKAKIDENGIVIDAPAFNPNAQKGFGFDSYSEGLELSDSIGLGDSDMDITWLPRTKGAFLVNYKGKAKEIPSSVKVAHPGRIVADVARFIDESSHERYYKALPRRMQEALRLLARFGEGVTLEEIIKDLQRLAAYESEHGIRLTKFARKKRG